MPERLRAAALLVALALLAACGGTQAGSPTEVPPALDATTVAPTLGAVLTEEAPGASPTPAEVAGTEQPQATTGVARATTAPTDAPAPTELPSAPAAPTAADAAGQGGLPQITLEQVASGMDDPLYLTNAGDGSGRLFVVEKRGRVVIVRDGQVVGPAFLDITDRVGSNANEQGLLSVAFHPRFAENGQFFVNYTDKAGDTVVSRFGASGDTADPASEAVLLTIDQPYANHNGGLVMFGPDGYLYIGMGDGGSSGDPQNNGQNAQALLGKLLRIDVDGEQPYGIPEDNPGGELAPEVWALGLRNPWRFSFDRATGDLYIADVGQNQLEEVNFTPAGTPGGVNYGWNVLEGGECFRGNQCDPAAFAGPVTEYSRDLGQSVTGGFVYRGEAYPALQGVYLFADFVSGRIWGLRQVNGEWERTELLDTDKNISSFGEDETGELYLTSIYEGAVFRVSLNN
jgi:glucose/arabinose dehydrogenase